MASPLIKIYVAIRSLKETQKRLEEILDVYNKLSLVGRNRIKFSFLAFYPTILEANSLIKNKIYISAEWAATLIFNNNESTRTAFEITIGHELSHKDGDFAILYWERESKLLIRKEDKKFVNWVTEVHHDFAAAVKMVASSKEKLLASMDYKISVKPNNEDNVTHPSWKRRKEYVEYIDPVTEKTGEFSEALVNKIAKDTDCNNIELIERVWKYYKLIVLH